MTSTTTMTLDRMKLWMVVSVGTFPRPRSETGSTRQCAPTQGSFLIFS